MQRPLEGPVDGISALAGDRSAPNGIAWEALAAACQVVGAVYRAPGEGLLDDLRSGRLGAVTDALAAWAGADPPTGPHAPPDEAALRSAHVALFVSRAGGVPAPPYVGLVRDRELMGPSVRRLQTELQSLGLRPRPDWRELPDHVAAVAEAVDLLLERGRVAAATGVAAAYLAPWFDRYADAVGENDPNGFYGELTRFLRAVLDEVTRGER